MAKAYQEAKGEIFSTFVALAVEVLKVQPDIADSSGHRYDQFVKTGNAILQVLGCDETMANLLERERQLALEEEVECQPAVLRALAKFMLFQRSWNKACAPLLEQLNHLTPTQNRGPDWPTTAQGLTGLMVEYRDSLKVMGIEFERGKDSNRGVRYIIKLNDNAPAYENDSVDLLDDI